MLTDIQERVAKLWRTADGSRGERRRDRRVAICSGTKDGGSTRGAASSSSCSTSSTTCSLDLFWGIFSHEVYGMLVLDRGLDRAQYAERMRTAVTALVPEG